MTDHTHDGADKWDIEITAGRSYLNIDLKEVWHYRDLMMLFVKKDIITVYKQTILGPIWFVLQPIFTTLIYVLVFGRVAKIPNGGVPPLLFYMGSVTLWNYFSETLNITSKTFSDNSSVFGKVYFPRIILPLSKIISGLIKLLIQFGLFIIFWLYYLAVEKAITPNWGYMTLFPLLLVIMAFISLAIGIIITSLTTKYRDLTFLVAFGVQLLMFATPVIYPVSIISPDKQMWLWLNPLTSIFELFKFAFLGSGTLSPFWLGYSILFTFVALLIGLVIFNKVEKRFIDTV